MRFRVQGLCRFRIFFQSFACLMWFQRTLPELRTMGKQGFFYDARVQRYFREIPSLKGIGLLGNGGPELKT